MGVSEEGMGRGDRSMWGGEEIRGYITYMMLVMW